MPILTQDAAEEPSKQGTRFLGESATGLWAELAVDASQWLTNVTAGGSSMTEAAPASDRFDLSHPRTIGVLAEIDNTDTGVFFTRGTAGTTLTLEINSAGTVRAVSDNIVVGSLAIPGLSGTPSDCVIAWASRENPLGTAGFDDVQSWLMVINDSTGEVARVEFIHAAATTSSTTATWGSFTGTITALWNSSRCQSLTEIAQDWGIVSNSAPLTSTDLDLPPLPVEQTTGIGDADQLQGPAYQWGVTHVRHALRRPWSPLANVVFAGIPRYSPTTAAGNPVWRLAPGSTDHYMALGWITPAPVPPGATHAWVRLHINSSVTSGGAVPIGVRVYSMNRLPDGAGSFVQHQVGEIVTRDDAGTGEWDIEALVELAIGEDGWTHLCPAIAIDPAGASGNDAAASILVQALHAVPCVAT